jgi:CRISPR-associated protein Cas5d
MRQVRTAIDETRDLGFMLFDLDFSDLSEPQPRFFRAQMTAGVIDVPDCSAAEVIA